MSAIAIDAGTSLIKAVVFDDDGHEVAVARHATEVRRPHPGWAEQDMDSVWQAVAAAIREVLPQARDGVRFVALTAQGDGCWLVDEHAEPTGPAILWSDGRAAPVVDRWLRDGVAQEAFRINGSLGFAGLPHAILTWLREHDPDRVASSATALTCGGWLFSRLTGVVGVDLSDASVPLLDPRTSAYSPELLSLFGIEWARPLLPRVLDGPDATAGLTRAAAAELGLAEGTPVVLAPYDVASTALGAGSTAAGLACTILGTTLCTEVFTPTVDTSGDPSGLTLVLGSGADLVRAFPTLAGTEVLGWASDLLGLAHPRELSALAEQAPPGAGGLVFLPYLSPAGERVPFLDTSARGTFWGLSLEHGRDAVARAVFEGLTMVVKDCLLAAGARTHELRVCGGGSNSEMWCRLIADVTGLRVVRPADGEVGAKGAFLTGLVATGSEPDLTRAARRHVRLDRTYEPEPDLVEGYADQYERFGSLRRIATRGWHLDRQGRQGRQGHRQATQEDPA
ncbi:FGGY-family carbohydrate kinase [Saccharomonospora cyanea]|uniref:Pentulose/hexulose kinase n=1 Tax=Saccharomonospora cyanea NA-134 TaxID=882082 RepID=H5XFS8_9PSEU|nr:FGGY-family carbohydrate kinase [Saccharomonospora cyanea]EHR60470.1 pentulose/hexulose kinase [Saccharomonospora cyanea NA-134]